MSVVTTWLHRTVATAAVLAATATPLHAASLFLDVELGDTAIAYLDQETQARLWPQIWTQAQLIAYYVPTQNIEGETQTTSSRLKLTSCLEGVACIPDPHIETETSQVEREVKASPQVLQGVAGRHLKLRYEFPEVPAPHYRFSHAEMRGPADVLWHQPLFDSWNRDLPPSGQRSFGQRRTRPLLIPLVLAKQPTPGFQLVDLDLNTPGQLMHQGHPLAMTTVRASLTGPDGKARQMVPLDMANPAISQKLFVPPEVTQDGQIPFNMRGALMPHVLSSMHAKERLSKIPMPESTPRWHGLKHYNFPEGTWVKLTESGPLAQVELEANAGPERAIDSRVPVKRETWMFFQDKLVHYRGQLHYGNNADQMPTASWQVNWDNEIRLHATAGTASPSSLTKRVPECRWQACRDNLAEARGQMAASDAQLQAEGERYLKLARGRE